MKKILIIFLSLALVASVAAVDLDSLMVKSIGGPEALAKLRSLERVQQMGTVSFNNMEGKYISFFELPNKYYLEIDFPIFKMVQAYDGETAWQTNINGQVSIMNGMEKKQLMNDIYFMSSSTFFDDRLEGSKEYLGTEIIDSVEYHKVAFYPYNADTSYIYFDMNSELPMLRTSNSDIYSIKTQLYDFRFNDNILYAFKTVSTINPIGMKMSTITSQIIHNPDFDESIFEMPDPDNRDYSFPEGVDSVIIPMEYSNGHIKMDATINGQKKIKVILDSGASANIFNSGVLDEFNFEVVGTLPSIGIGGSEEINLMEIDSIEVGGLNLYGQVAGSMDMTAIAQGLMLGDDFGGIIGYDFLSRFPILVDYANHTLTVYNPDSFEPPQMGVEIPFYLTIQLPTITASLEGIEGDFIVDLGNAAGLIVHKKFSDNNKLEKLLEDVHANDAKIGGVGGDVGGKSGMTNNFRIGGMLIDSLRIFIPDTASGILGSREIAGNIGNRILENSKVLFDYRHSRLIFLKK